MNITYHGLNCFKIQGKDIVVVLDPKQDIKIGLKPPSFKTDILCLNNPQEEISNIKPNQENVFLISAPGEYETNGVFIYSFFYPDNQNLIYHLKIDEVKIVHLGNLNKILNDSTIEKLNGVDILMVPTGGGDVLSADKAIEVVNQLEPKIIIPMHYKMPGLSLKLDQVDKFCQEMGIKDKNLLDKLKISKKDLNFPESKIIVIKNT